MNDKIWNIIFACFVGLVFACGIFAFTVICQFVFNLFVHFVTSS